MRSLKKRVKLPRPAIVIAVIALVVALTGTAVAAKKLGLGALSDGAKNKTVGVGKLTYVTVTTNATQPEQNVTPAQCPAGLTVIGGGIRLSNPGIGTSFILDSHSITNGWAGKVVFNNANQTATTTAICGISRVVTGTPGG